MKIISSFSQYGWAIIPRILKGILRRIGIVFETYYLLEYIIDPIIIEDKMKKYNYSNVKLLQMEDLIRLKDFENTKIELFKKRFMSNQYSGYAIFQDDNLVYLTWISWTQMNYPSLFNLKHPLLNNEALLEDSYCNPDYRGKGFHSMMNIFRMNEINKYGKTKVLALVLKENKPALKVQIKSGFNFKELISIKKFGKWSKITKKLYYD